MLFIEYLIKFFIFIKISMNYEGKNNKYISNLTNNTNRKLESNRGYSVKNVFI